MKKNISVFCFLSFSLFLQAYDLSRYNNYEDEFFARHSPFRSKPLPAVSLKSKLIQNEMRKTQL